MLEFYYNALHFTFYMIFDPVPLPELWPVEHVFRAELAMFFLKYSIFMFELRACILCASPVHNSDTASKDFSRLLSAQGKF